MRVIAKLKATSVLLDKRERDRLTQAGQIVAGLAKHADGDLQEVAQEAEKALRNLEEVLNPEPTVALPY